MVSPEEKRVIGAALDAGQNPQGNRLKIALVKRERMGIYRTAVENVNRKTALVAALDPYVRESDVKPAPKELLHMIRDYDISEEILSEPNDRIATAKECARLLKEQSEKRGQVDSGKAAGRDG